MYISEPKEIPKRKSDYPKQSTHQCVLTYLIAG